MTDTTQQIRRRAYFLWEAAGRPHGRDDEFWAEALDELEGGRLVVDEIALGKTVPSTTATAEKPKVRKPRVAKPAGV